MTPREEVVDRVANMIFLAFDRDGSGMAPHIVDVVRRAIADEIMAAKRPVYIVKSSYELSAEFLADLVVLPPLEPATTETDAVRCDLDAIRARHSEFRPFHLWRPFWTGCCHPPTGVVEPCGGCGKSREGHATERELSDVWALCGVVERLREIAGRTAVCRSGACDFCSGPGPVSAQTAANKGEGGAP